MLAPESDLEPIHIHIYIDEMIDDEIDEMKCDETNEMMIIDESIKRYVGK